FAGPCSLCRDKRVRCIVEDLCRFRLRYSRRVCRQIATSTNAGMAGAPAIGRRKPTAVLRIPTPWMLARVPAAFAQRIGEQVAARPSFAGLGLLHQHLPELRLAVG